MYVVYLDTTLEWWLLTMILAAEVMLRHFPAI